MSVSQNNLAELSRLQRRMSLRTSARFRGSRQIETRSGLYSALHNVPYVMTSDPERAIGEQYNLSRDFEKLEVCVT